MRKELLLSALAFTLFAANVEGRRGTHIPPELSGDSSVAS